MNGIIASIAASILQPLRQSMWRSGRVVMLALVALAFLFVALGFATAAILSWLSSLYGPTPAALLMASSFLLLAAVALAFAARLYSTDRRPVAAGSKAARPGAPVMSSNTISAGELASLVQGMATGSKLKPFELVSLAVITGFLAGRRK